MCCELWATLCLADELCVLTFLPGRDLTLHVSVWRAECAMLTCCGPGLLKQVRPRWVVLEVNRGASLGHIIFFADKNVRARFPRPHAHERICECTCMPALATSSATTCARMYSCVCLCLCLSFLSVFSVSVSFSLSVSFLHLLWELSLFHVVLPSSHLLTISVAHTASFCVRTGVSASDPLRFHRHRKFNSRRAWG